MGKSFLGKSLSFALSAAFLSAAIFVQNTSAAILPEAQYWGYRSQEATLTFQNEVEFKATPAQAKSESFVRKKIDRQIQHLYGPMSDTNPKAAPKGTYRLSRISVTSTHQGGLYRAQYAYEGEIVVQFTKRTTYRVPLPVNPDRVYQAGLVGENAPCTDPHYQTEGDFWYFWSPKHVGCPLREGVDFTYVTGDLDIQENTKETFPEYKKLLDDSGTLRIDLLIGLIDGEKYSTDVDKSRDPGATEYREVHRWLLDKGFEGRIWTSNETQEYLRGLGYADRFKYTPRIEELKKTTPTGTLLVRMFFGYTEVSEDADVFHYVYKDGLENASVMLYAGHSGLGGNLDLDDLEATHGFKIELPKNRYQIYLFDSCSSYSYYNSRYFDRKKTDQDPSGTKNLDILTNGLSSIVSDGAQTVEKIISAFDAYLTSNKATSYQTLIRSITQGYTWGDYLTGVNGDEDNADSN